MIGCSMFIFSISALIYSVAPARANVQEKTPLVKSNSTAYQFVLPAGPVNYIGLPNGKNGKYIRDWEQVAM